MKNTNMNSASTSTRPELIVTRGISNSGKSTWAKAWIAESPETRRRVNRDDIREVGFTVPSYVMKEEELVTDFQQGAVRSLLEDGYSVVVDDMFLVARFVRPFYNLAQELDVEFRVESFPIALSEALKRAKNRAEQGGLAVPEDAIRKMFKRTKNGMPYDLPDFSVSTDRYASRKLALEETLKNTYIPSDDLSPAVIVDIDGTLTMGIHPDRSPFEWLKVDLDLPRPAVINVINLLHASGVKVFVTSGRDAVCRDITERWLKLHGVPFDGLFMREKDDQAPDDVVKAEIFEREFRGQFNIVSVFDDRGRVCRLWHALGLDLFRIGDPFSDF